MTNTLEVPATRGSKNGAAPAPEPHAGFRAAQRLAYECVLAVEATLAPGVTEREVASAMERWLLARGVGDWFHRPFAWFGDRTAFRSFRSPLAFFPSHRRLEEGVPFILDVAPVLDGHAADIGYASCLGENRLLARMQQDLAEHRALILASVRAGKAMRDVYADVDLLLLRQGYDNRHREYPGRVLAHRVSTLSGPLAGRTIAGFGVRGVASLGRAALAGRGRSGGSPLWGPATDGPPAPGVWAVEPHLGLRGVGAKFEELLVVTEDDARWLDDDLPHVRRWRSA